MVTKFLVKHIIQTTGEASVGDHITIDFVIGDSITDTDAKFGWMTYYYNKNNKKWMVKFPDESGNTDTIFHKPAVILAVLADGFPIFRGTGRWATIIIPLSRTNFLKCNIIGGGATDALYFIAGTVKKIK